MGRYIEYKQHKKAVLAILILDRMQYRVIQFTGNSGEAKHVRVTGSGPVGPRGPTSKEQKRTLRGGGNVPGLD